MCVTVSEQTCFTGTKVQILTQTALLYSESVPINALVPVEGTPLEMKVLLPLHLALLLFLLLLRYAVPIFFFPTPGGQYRLFFEGTPMEVMKLCISIYAYLYVCMYVCMYFYTYTHTHTHIR